jgi:eukaryotic-like serine/threonine-protein kinase
MRYRAFISYSHKDARWARWLHRSLEGYRIPTRLRGSVGEFGPLPDRLLPMFRDREDLASAGNLSPKIEAALADSEALIVVCSPDAARSPWVEGEVLRFKRSGRSNRIYCLIVAGEPNAGDQRECFAPALRFELDADGELGTRAAEPVAADVRPGTDGKSLARLKLLSGLLGVDLDTLRRREAARRQRRLLAIATLSVLVMLVTSFLAVQAVIARQAAERRQKQAEALVGFMLGDLTDKLAQVSRLDIMESVSDQAMAYFQSLPTTDVTEQSLAQRVTALTKIGNVRTDQGHLPEALQSYQAASALSASLVQAAPTDLGRQLAHSRILTFIGTTYWHQGDLDRAEKGFKSAQAVLLRAKPVSPDNADLLYQLSTLDNNLGHVLEGRGRFDQALVQYRNMLALSLDLVRIDPGNREWVSQSGLAHNNLAKMALLRGHLATAVSEYQADLAIEVGLARRDPRDNDQAERVVLSRAAFGRTLAMTGHVDAGIAQLRQSLDGVERLLSVDPENASFKEDAGLYSTQVARWLRVNGDATTAAALAARGLDIFERLARQDPGNAGWQRSLAEARIEQAEQERDRGRRDLAREQAQQALAILDSLLAQQAQDRTTVLATLAARLLSADVAEDAASARQLREQSLRTAQSQSAGRGDPRLMAIQVETLLALGRSSEAQAILPTLWNTGFRDPRFVGLLRRQGLRTPTVVADPVDAGRHLQGVVARRTVVGRRNSKSAHETCVRCAIGQLASVG